MESERGDAFTGKIERRQKRQKRQNAKIKEMQKDTCNGLRLLSSMGYIALSRSALCVPFSRVRVRRRVRARVRVRVRVRVR
jgi:hypothetical protein